MQRQEIVVIFLRNGTLRVDVWRELSREGKGRGREGKEGKEKSWPKAVAVSWKKMQCRVKDIKFNVSNRASEKPVKASMRESETASECQNFEP
jgi:hypothetical protein